MTANGPANLQIHFATVNGNVRLNDDVLVAPDGNEYVTNAINGNLDCSGNSPAPQIGDSGGSTNTVTTGMVGRALAGRLAELGHDVAVGTRDAQETLARSEPDAMGTPPYAQWQQDHPAVRLVGFAEAGAHGELVVNATAGAAPILVQTHRP